MAVMAAGAWPIVHGEGANDAHASGLGRALGVLPPVRIREGHVPAAMPPKPTGEEPEASAAPHDAATGGPEDQISGPLPAPAVDPPAIGDSARITGTGGVGVVLRALPRLEARVPRGLLENTRVTVLDHAGDAWTLVRAENGLEGWVPTQYVGRES